MRNFEILSDGSKKLSKLDVIIAQLNIQLTLLKKSIKKRNFEILFDGSKKLSRLDVIIAQTKNNF